VVLSKLGVFLHSNVFSPFQAPLQPPALGCSASGCPSHHERDAQMPLSQHPSDPARWEKSTIQATANP